MSFPILVVAWLIPLFLGRFDEVIDIIFHIWLICRSLIKILDFKFTDFATVGTSLGCLDSFLLCVGRCTGYLMFVSKHFWYFVSVLLCICVTLTQKRSSSFSWCSWVHYLLSSCFRIGSSNLGASLCLAFFTLLSLHNPLLLFLLLFFLQK